MIETITLVVKYLWLVLLGSILLYSIFNIIFSIPTILETQKRKKQVINNYANAISKEIENILQELDSQVNLKDKNENVIFVCTNFTRISVRC